MTSDIFDDVLNLEEQYYQEGYEQGYRDGAEAGRVEGRSVGMKQGYEKFLEAGRLQGRALVWANRIPRLRSPPAQAQQPQSNSRKQELEPELKPQSTLQATSLTSPSHTQSGGSGTDADADAGSAAKVDSSSGNKSRRRRLPDLIPSNNARLERNVATLYGMVEPGTLSTRNEDEAVNDFDSRVKGAQGKLKIIERVVGEKITVVFDSNGDGVVATAGGGSKNDNIEDIGRIPQPRGERTDHHDV